MAAYDPGIAAHAGRIRFLPLEPLFLWMPVGAFGEELGRRGCLYKRLYIGLPWRCCYGGVPRLLRAAHHTPGNSR